MGKEFLFLFEKNFSLAEFDAETRRDPATPDTEYAHNPFLRLPFDGLVGLLQDRLEREGYGVDLIPVGGSDLSRCPLTGEADDPLLHGSAARSRGRVRLEVEVREGHNPDRPALALEIQALGTQRFRFICYPDANPDPNFRFTIRALTEELQRGRVYLESAEDRLRWIWRR